MQSKEGREIWSQTRGTSAQPRPMPVTGGERLDRQKVVSRETGWSGHPSACAGGCHRAGMWACPATHIPSKKSLKSRFEHGILQFLNVGNDLKHFPKHSVGQTKHVCRPGGSVRSRARHRPALCSPRHTGPAGHHATPGSAPKRRGRCALASRIAHRGRPCWQALLSLRLHVAENSAGAGPRHTGFRSAHTRGQLLGHTFYLGNCRCG